MAVHCKTHGFVFKREDRLDADRIFSVFTKEFGRVEIFAKAIRKINSKLKGGIEVFSFSDIEFIRGKMRKTLTDAVFVYRFGNIIQVPEKFKTAREISYFLDHFIRGEEKDEEIFNLLSDAFSKLNDDSTIHHPLITSYFFWNFVSILGYSPELSKCAACSQKLDPYHLYFSNKEGGVMCKQCADQKRDGVKISSDSVKILRLIVKRDWSILSKLKMEKNTQDALKKISDDYRNYLLNYLHYV